MSASYNIYQLVKSMSFEFSRVSDQINQSILHLNHVINLMQKFLMLFSETFDQDLNIDAWFI